MSDSANHHYDENYFGWQTSVGEFGGWANLSKFSPHVSADDDVLDFGCGGGFLLKNLICRRRMGIEINPAAAATARANGVEVYSRVRDMRDDSVDVVISNHALEHTLQPFEELKELHAKLRSGGRVVFFVPCESIAMRYRTDDIHHHLYTWSPLCLGNLFAEAGYSVIESTPYIHKWPPGYRRIAKLGGRALFELACRIYGRLESSSFQVKLIAEKKTSRTEKATLSPMPLVPGKGLDRVVMRALVERLV